MPQGRRRLEGTHEERAEIRRAQVRLNVEAFRQRQREKYCANTTSTPGNVFTIIIERPSLKCQKKSISISNDRPCTTSVVDCSGLSKTHAQHGGTSSSTHGLPLIIDQRHAYKGAFFNALLESYKPSPHALLNSSGLVLEGEYKQWPVHDSRESWIANACDGAGYYGAGYYDAGALGDAILAWALGLVGRRQDDMQLMMASRRVYQRALTEIGHSVAVLRSSQMPDKLANGFLASACFACAWVELVVNQSMENSKRHLVGVASFISSCDVAWLEHPVMRALFWEHRGVYIGFSFLDRQPCFYTQPKWIEYARSKSTERDSHHYDTLLDIAYSVPVLMEEYDLMNLDSSIPRLRELIKSVVQLSTAMDNWKTNMETLSLVPLMKLSLSPKAHPFVAQVTYSSLSSALALLHYCAFKIHLLLILLDITIDLRRHRQPAANMASHAFNRSIECARVICSSMNYCLSLESGIIGKSIARFPFDTAWQAFIRLNGIQGHDMTKEIAFCEAIANRSKQIGVTLVKDRRQFKRG